MAARKDGDLSNPFGKGEGEGAAAPEPSEEGERVEVALEPDEDEDDDEPAAAGAAPAPQRESARDRRRNRYKEQKEGRERAERELEETRTRLRDLEARVMAPQPAPQAPAEPLDAQYAKALDEIYAERQALAKLYNHFVSKGAFDESTEKLLWGKQRELDTRTARLNADYARLSDPSRQPGASGPTEAQRATQTWLQLEHSDVPAHPSGRAIMMYAAAEEARLVQNGAPGDLNTARRAMDAAKLHFGLTRRPAPSPERRARYNGAGSAGGTGGGAPNGNGGGTIVLTKAQQEMAEARFPNLPKEQAFKQWARGPGRKMLENRGKSG
jgi:hypothetical protein